MATAIGMMYVRRSAFVQATPERVWEEFTSFDRLREWFGIGHTLHAYEPRPGGVVELSVDLRGTRQHFGGTITAFEPNAEVTFACNWHDESLAWSVPTMWTLRLSASYDGTTVEIFHHGFERLGRAGGAALEALEAGWDNKHLKALRAIAER
jgi:uncharacterized protein YndB with AHSA1/START domain